MKKINRHAAVIRIECVNYATLCIISVTVFLPEFINFVHAKFIQSTL